MRFGLRCIVSLAILYRAILVSQGGSGTAALSSKLADAAPVAQARMRDEIAVQVGAYCRSEPATCLAAAARVASARFISPAEPRHPQHGAIASVTR